MAGEGMFVKGAAKVVEPPRLEYKGFKLKFSRKGSICRSLIVRARYAPVRPSGDRVRFRSNDTIIIKRRQEVKSKYIYGPGSRGIRRRRFLSIFAATI
jgi:ribosomal protein L14